MTDGEIHEKALAMQAEEMATGESGWYYLSFAGEEGFRGACIINACGPSDAFIQATRLRLNPGGEVICFECPREGVRPEWTGRLLSRADMESLDMKPIPLSEVE